MNLAEIARKLQFDVMSGEESLTCEIRGGYASDLISDVIANAQEGDLWVTLQTHQNTVAVAKRLWQAREYRRKTTLVHRSFRGNLR